MSAAVMGGGAGAGAEAAGPFAGAAFAATSVWAQAPPAVAVRIKAVKIRFWLSFMEVQSSPFSFVAATATSAGEQQNSSRDRAGETFYLRVGTLSIQSFQPAP
jgi:hypothetical protein